MSDEKFKINVEKETNQLRNIREKLGIPEINVIIRTPTEIDEEIEGDKIISFFHPSGCLIDPETKSPVFLYITDHTVGPYSVDTPSEELRRIHFTHCRTLAYMSSIGRFESRYRKTSREDDIYLVAFSSRRGQEEHHQVRLCPCVNCLIKSGYKCYHIMPSEKREHIFKEFKAKEARDLMWQIFDEFKESVRDSLRSIILLVIPQNRQRLVINVAREKTSLVMSVE